jgi:hypothetical protein
MSAITHLFAGVRHVKASVADGNAIAFAKGPDA